MTADEKALRIARHLQSLETMGAEWGMEIEEAREGYVRLAVTVNENMLNGHRTAHGGTLFTIADTAFAYACNSHGQHAVAHAANISFLSPAHPGDRLIAEAEEIMRSGRSGAYSVVIKTAQGRPIASFHGLSRSLGTDFFDPET